MLAALYFGDFALKASTRCLFHKVIQSHTHKNHKFLIVNDFFKLVLSIVT